MASDGFLGLAAVVVVPAVAVVAAGGPFRLDTPVLDLEAVLWLAEDVEELLFLVLDVFKCMGPVLEPVLGRASGSILRADLALATMPVLMEPDFT